MFRKYPPINLLPLSPYEITCDTEEEHNYLVAIGKYCYRSNDYYKRKNILESTEFSAIFMFVILNQDVINNAEGPGYKVIIPTKNLLVILLNFDDEFEDFLKKIPDSLCDKLMDLLS